VGPCDQILYQRGVGQAAGHLGDHLSQGASDWSTALSLLAVRCAARDRSRHGELKDRAMRRTGRCREAAAMNLNDRPTDAQSHAHTVGLPHHLAAGFASDRGQPILARCVDLREQAVGHPFLEALTPYRVRLTITFWNILQRRRRAADFAAVVLFLRRCTDGSCVP
jgi:hypothetical protein